MFFAAIIITIDENNEGDETAQAQMSGLLITVVVAPFLAMLWYGLSFIPYGRKILGRMASWLFGL